MLQLMLQACLKLLQNTVNSIRTTLFSYIQSTQKPDPNTLLACPVGLMAWYEHGMLTLRGTYSYYFIIKEYSEFLTSREQKNFSLRTHIHICNHSKSKWLLYFCVLYIYSHISNVNACLPVQVWLNDAYKPWTSFNFPVWRE